MKTILIILTGIVTSLYFFPFNTTYIPITGMNTKMLLAVIGLVILGKNLAQRQDSILNKNFLIISLWGLAVSLVGFISIILNDTYDYTYATYFMSMWVWLGGAYTVTRLIKAVHGYVSVQLIGDYLIGVCAAQCLLAITMDQYAPFKEFVDSFLVSEGFMGKVEGRLYGIGASLDVGGMRFATILLIIAYFSINTIKLQSSLKIFFYVLSFIIIVFIGNMIGRTTIVGAIMAIVYGIIAYPIMYKKNRDDINILTKCIIITSLIFIPLIVFLYHTNQSIHSNIRFAFEGFFSLYEKGKWETHSNEILKTMYVFPDNSWTWIIGDGYFNNPSQSPYYIGPQWKGFYQDTDAGYLRFIYYFGMTGLLIFIGYIYQTAAICVQKFSNYKTLFGLILLLNYIVWMKVSSDLFLVFALFLCISQEENDEYEKEIEKNTSLFKD